MPIHLKFRCLRKCVKNRVIIVLTGLKLDVICSLTFSRKN